MANGLPRAPYVRVTVTQDIIDRAMIANSGHCMTADAVKVAFPGAINVAVDIQTIRFSDRERRLRYIYLTPRRVQIAIVDWDDGLEIEPFDFVLGGGSVTEMGGHVSNRNKLEAAHTNPDVEAVKQKHRVRLAKYHNKKLPKEAQLRIGGKGFASKPEVIGGQEPPVSRFSLRREFGLRAFQRRNKMEKTIEEKGLSPQRANPQ